MRMPALVVMAILGARAAMAGRSGESGAAAKQEATPEAEWQERPDGSKVKSFTNINQLRSAMKGMAGAPSFAGIAEPAKGDKGGASNGI